MEVGHFNGRVAIVTGAAHGIGRSICMQLATRGARVHACDMDAAALETTRKSVSDAGGSIESEIVDVTDSERVNAFVNRVAEEDGRIDILVNVAGGVAGQVHHPVEEISDKDWDRVVRINLYGTFNFCRAVAPHMKAARWGRIINISSGAGRSHSLTGIQAYASAKAGEIGLTRQLARELGNWNITVNCVAPGFVLSNPTTEKQWEDMGAEGQKNLIGSIALHRVGKPEEIAYPVVFFASDYASYISGQTISADGGKWMLG